MADLQTLRLGTTNKELIDNINSNVNELATRISTKTTSVALASGTNNGTLQLTVDGTATDNIAVTGLGSAAFTDSTAYDASGAAAAVLGTSSDTAADTTVYGVQKLAKGATIALSYASISAFVTAFNSANSEAYKTGQNIYIQTREVPDLWVYSVESTSSSYTYSTDAAFVAALSASPNYVQVGYYRVASLETEKVDLSGLVSNVSYDSTNKKIQQTKGGIASDVVTFGLYDNFHDGWVPATNADNIADAVSQSSLGSRYLSDDKKWRNLPANAYKDTTYTAEKGVTLPSGTFKFKASLTQEGNNSSAATRDTSSNDGGLYAVELDKNGKLAVKVPWVNTAGLSYNATNHSVKSNLDNTEAIIPIGGLGGLGLVKDGLTVSGSKTYGVDIDAYGAMTVSVPWTDTTYNVATTTTNGLMSAEDKVLLSDAAWYVSYGSPYSYVEIAPDKIYPGTNSGGYGWIENGKAFDNNGTYHTICLDEDFTSADKLNALTPIVGIFLKVTSGSSTTYREINIQKEVEFVNSKPKRLYIYCKPITETNTDTIVLQVAKPKYTV